jgi:TatD DNase family protein
VHRGDAYRFPEQAAMKRAQQALPALPADAELIDTHCHLDMESFAADLEAVIRSAAEHGVRRIVTIGIDEASSRRAVALADRYSGVYATIGFHPHDAIDASGTALDRIALLASEAKVVAYGEIGLDYVKQYAAPEVQRRAFANQLSLARTLELPVVIHDREAHADCLDLLRKAGPLPRGGVMHCFSGDCRLAREVIDLGLLVSIPGVVTFNNAADLREVVRSTDLDHLLLETDGPFLAPVPRRGKRNEPKLLLHTAQMVAQLKQVELSEVARATTANAVRLFRLPPEGARHAL